MVFERHYFADTQTVFYSIIKEAKYLGGRRPRMSENTLSCHGRGKVKINSKLDWENFSATTG